MSANPIIEGRAFLYGFDFLKFRNRAEETIRPVHTFHCQGMCWKFRYAGVIRVYVNGELIAGIYADNQVNSYSPPIPLTINVGDEVCVEVFDSKTRWFRWFRPNTAHVALEGLESA